MRTLIIILLFISLPVFGTRYYVSTSGLNSNSGLDSLHSWSTLLYAENHSNPGDVIALKRGNTWSLTSALAIKHSGTTWDGSLWGTGANAVIKSSANRSGNNMAIVNIIGCSFVTFQNITVDGNNTQVFGLVIGGHTGYSGNVQNNENHISILNCSILNCGNGSGYTIAFLCQTFNTDISDITIKSCTLDGSDDEQLSFYGGKSSDNATPKECKNVYIGYNTLTNWGRRGQSTGYGLQINNKITNVIIEYNTLTTGKQGHGNGIHIESNETVPGFFPSIVVIKNNKVNITESNKFCLFIQGGQAKTIDVTFNTFIQGNSLIDTDGGGVWIVASDWTNAKLNFFNNHIKSLSGRTFQNDCTVPGAVILMANTLINTGSLDYTSFDLITAPGLIHGSNTFIRTENFTKVKEKSYLQSQSQVLAWESTAKFVEPVPVNDTIYLKIIGKKVIIINN
jgi:hypothetical protein